MDVVPGSTKSKFLEVASRSFRRRRRSGKNALSKKKIEAAESTRHNLELAEQRTQPQRMLKVGGPRPRLRLALGCGHGKPNLSASAQRLLGSMTSSASVLRGEAQTSASFTRGKHSDSVKSHCNPCRMFPESEWMAFTNLALGCQHFADVIDCNPVSKNVEVVAANCTPRAALPVEE